MSAVFWEVIFIIGASILKFPIEISSNYAYKPYYMGDKRTLLLELLAYKDRSNSYTYLTDYYE